MTALGVTKADLVDPSALLDALAPGGGLLTGVPCSLLTPVFDAGGERSSHRFVPATSEGEAIAIAAGYAAAGGESVAAMQNSGLGHALDPLLSLALPFEIPLAILVSHRGHPEFENLAHHDAMGRITHPLIALAGIDTVDLGDAPMADLADDWANRRLAGQCIAVVVRPGVLGACLVPDGSTRWIGRRLSSSRPLDRESAAGAVHLDARYEREDVLRAVLDGVDEAVVIGTTGHTSRQLFALGDRDRNVYLSGSMGHADAFGLGVSIDHPDLEVIVLDGDGAALMHLGNLATIGAFGGRGYRHIILDNAAHATTGGQPTVSPGVSFVDLAMALGYAAAASSTEFSTIGEAIAWLRGTSGPALLHAPIVATTRTNLPRVGVAPPDQKLRLRKTITRSAGAAGSRRRVAGQ